MILSGWPWFPLLFCACSITIQLCPTLCNPMDYSLPCSMEFSRQEYWCGLPCLPSEDLPDPGVKLKSLEFPGLEGGFFTTAPPGKPSLVIWWSEVKVAQLCLPLWDPMDYSPWNSPARILEWVAYPFYIGSFQPRNWTGVSCIAGRFFTNWAMREALVIGGIQFIGINIRGLLGDTGFTSISICFENVTFYYWYDELAMNRFVIPMLRNRKYLHFR